MTAIPAELRERRQWVIWRRETVNGRPTKILYRAGAPSTRASSTDPTTWANYNDAVRAAPAADGIGFVFSDSDPYVGVDLDDVVNDDATVHPYAAELVGQLDSYTELSPSGRGLHVFVRATLNGGRKRTTKTPWGSDFETYTTGRYFTVTGKPMPGTPPAINERQAQLDAIRAELLPDEPKAAPKHPPQPSPLADDAELLDRASKAKNGATFDALWRGDVSAHAGDNSAADLALCGALAFWTGPDPARIDGLFRRSGLMREKWDSRRGDSTSGQRTIDTALSGRREFYEARGGANSQARAPDAYEVTFDTSGKVPKLVLPEIPPDDDPVRQCAWLTCVFNLNPEHPITGGAWQGVLGPDGQIVLHRGAAKDLRFEPARAMKTPMRLIESFVGRKHTGDGMLHPFKADHCRLISHVVECLCDTSQALTEEQEAVGIVGAFLQLAEAIEGLTTYGTAPQRYEAARALRSDTGLRYLIDTDTGELVIGVSDLAERARKTIGGSLPRGWLDGRMANLAWDRARLDGHAQPGRSGRGGLHATVNVYRGHLPAVTK